jgi:hypothetical protein
MGDASGTVSAALVMAASLSCLGQPLRKTWSLRPAQPADRELLRTRNRATRTAPSASGGSPSLYIARGRILRYPPGE